MLRFNTTIHVCPPEPGQHDAPVKLGDDIEVRPLAATNDMLYAPFGLTFEEVAMALEAIDGLFFEPDGSFVWGRGADRDRWQLDGHLYDRHERLLYASLKGSAPESEVNRVLAALGWPQMPLCFQLQDEGVVLDEDEFRRYGALKAERERAKADR